MSPLNPYLFLLVVHPEASGAASTVPFLPVGQEVQEVSPLQAICPPQASSSSPPAWPARRRTSADGHQGSGSNRSKVQGAERERC